MIVCYWFMVCQRTEERREEWIFLLANRNVVDEAINQPPAITIEVVSIGIQMRRTDLNTFRKFNLARIKCQTRFSRKVLITNTLFGCVF